jgi:hypothetical protein
MIISDLNFVQSVDAHVEGATGNINRNINFNENFRINKNIFQNVNLRGNTATFDITNNAFGRNTTTQSFVDNRVNQGRSSTTHLVGVAAAS